MIHRQKKGIHWLEFEILQGIPELVHGIFLREGGVSKGPFQSLNVGEGIGDFSENVKENCRRIQETLPIQTLMSGKQVHGDQIVIVESEKDVIGACDGLMTQKKELALMVRHADCQAALIFDPIQRVVANVHAGWRGNVKNIYAKAIEKMENLFGSKAQNLLVGISPSLGPDHAEFKEYKTEFPQEFWQFQTRLEHFDLWALAKHQLQECGVLAEHIEIARICTYANSQDFFSYRRDHLTGRHATCVMLL